VGESGEICGLTSIPFSCSLPLPSFLPQSSQVARLLQEPISDAQGVGHPGHEDLHRQEVRDRDPARLRHCHTIPHRYHQGTFPPPLARRSLGRPTWLLICGTSRGAPPLTRLRRLFGSVRVQLLPRDVQRLQRLTFGK